MFVSLFAVIFIGTTLNGMFFMFRLFLAHLVARTHPGRAHILLLLFLLVT